MSAIFSTIGNAIYSAWTSVYYMWGTPSEPGSGGLENIERALGRNQPPTSQQPKALTGRKGGGDFSATHLTHDCFADVLQYISPSDDVAVIALAAAQTCTTIRDKLAPTVFAEHHTITRYTRASPEQGNYLLETFSKARPATTNISKLCLREVRTQPSKALSLITARTPLQLTEIDFYKTDLTWETEAFVKALSQCPNVTTITLSDCNITAKVLQEIAPTILQRLPNLQKLDLSNNRFRVEGAVALASMEFFLDPVSTNFGSSLKQLTSLDLGGNSLGNKGVDALLRLGFPGKFTPNLQLLDLRNNALQDDGARTVMRYLAKNMRDNKPSPIEKLAVLEVSDNGIEKEMEAQMRELFHGVKIFVQ